MANLILGFGSAVLVGLIAVARRRLGLAWSALAMPLYWLMVSAAAYRALWQLITAPHYWEKTSHGLHTPGPGARPWRRK